MGESVSKFVSGYVPYTVMDAYNNISNKRKRLPSSAYDESNLEQVLHSPKKRKLSCTTQYIYKALFVDGRNYDIIVDVLGKEWKLHKLYLTQSPYFQSMFSGSWRETNNKYVNIKVADPNITIDSLKVVFGSLYMDEILIEPADVVGILAAGILFQLDGLIDQCVSVMLETISPLTAISYYEAANQYGLQRIKQATIKWFLVNLMTFYPFHSKRMRQIEPDLMALLVKDRDLIVVQTEFCLYHHLRFWVFLKLHPHWTCESDPDRKQVTEFFRSRPDSTAFLLSPEGKDYLHVFEGLHIGSLMTQEQDLVTLKEDRILPETWLYSVLSKQWQWLLSIDSGKDQGPKDETVTHDVFFQSCIRCGRVLEGRENNTWKWKVFNFGLDLVWSTLNNVLTVSRSNDDDTLNDPRPRTIMLRVTLCNLDKQSQVKLTQTSEVMTVMLVRNIAAKIMDLCPEFEYPITVSVCLLSVTPQHTKQRGQTPAEIL